tara:strand:+ start:1507 stop:1809 length:303 start_codon:yes stop_codon:yes gene_type:complete
MKDLKHFINEGLNENKNFKLNQKIKVWKESYDKSPFNAILIKKVPNDYDDAYIASVDLGDGDRKNIKVAYGIISGPKNKQKFKKEVWFMLDPHELNRNTL